MVSEEGMCAGQVWPRVLGMEHRLHLLQAPPPEDQSSAQAQRAHFPHRTSQASQDWVVIYSMGNNMSTKGGGFSSWYVERCSLRERLQDFYVQLKLSQAASAVCMWQDMKARGCRVGDYTWTGQDFSLYHWPGWASSACGNFPASFGVTFHRVPLGPPGLTQFGSWLTYGRCLAFLCHLLALAVCVREHSLLSDFQWLGLKCQKFGTGPVKSHCCSNNFTFG